MDIYDVAQFRGGAEMFVNDWLRALDSRLAGVLYVWKKLWWDVKMYFIGGVWVVKNLWLYAFIDYVCLPAM